MRDAPGSFFMSETAKTTETPENPLPDAPAIPVAPGNLTENLIAGMPVPQEKPVERPAPVFLTDEPKFPDPGTAPLPGFEPLEKDDGGTVFNPAEHASDENGKPKKNARGRFYSKFIGRGGAAKRAGATAPGSAAPKTERPLPKFEGAPENNRIPTAEQVDAVQPGQDARGPGEQTPDAAEGMSLMIIPTVDGIAQSVFGPDIALTGNDVKAAQPVLAGYLRQKNVRDISPGWALVAVCSAIYLPKFAKPTVKERLTLLVLKVRNLLGIGGK